MSTRAGGPHPYKAGFGSGKSCVDCGLPRAHPFHLAQPWPKLSETCKAERRLDVCQNCGGGAHLITLHRWREHDESDNPTVVVVVLCDPCAANIIDPHPRLYRRMHEHEPAPGAMSLCTGCAHQDALGCRHPKLKHNGGEGLVITFPRPDILFVDGTRNGRRAGWREVIYKGPVESCEGRS